MSPRPSGPAFTPDPAKVPRTAEAARELARAVVAGPELWGPGFVARTPALSAPGHWPVLDERCVWQGGTVPAGVLHSVTSYSERPAGAGRGTLRVAATVTVHRDVRRAEWEMAETLEEALRCPGQKLREGERVEGLMSIGHAFGSKYNLTADDSIGEIGRYRGTESGDRPYEYGWFQYRLGNVTVAAVTKGADGHTQDEINRARVDALVGMARRIETRLETAG
ncbi:hypothetical protein GCM10010387_53520 [Streptomyces inusitatus]|uniref:Uncharacterized protein n=1 Tax=Streptomyces inusitatus TaxID=68221 RepID=A0A918QIP5_9ACTN|nr:hypothetical protein GCM10010387_53520 [Streptomyces inusitatus]